ncbi:MAG: DUF721 domain-containing protein [Fusobacterium sp.]|nr:DUF721 domain-containing protein [Fusobacterium sp.]
MMELTNVGMMIDSAIGKSRKLKEGIIKARWQEISGKLFEKSSILYIKDKTLYIAVENSAILHFMQLKKDEYIKKINSLFKDKVVDNLSFFISRIVIDRELYNMYMDNNNLSGDGYFEDEDIDFKHLNIQEKIEHLRKSAERREKYLLEKGYKKCKECGSLFLGEEELCKICRLKLKADDEMYIYLEDEKIISGKDVIAIIDYIHLNNEVNKEFLENEKKLKKIINLAPGSEKSAVITEKDIYFTSYALATLMRRGNEHFRLSGGKTKNE